MVTLICLTWIGVVLNAPVWYFVILALAVCYNAVELFRDDTTKKGE